MGTQGIDVILGMNWLDKFQAIISYDKRTVKLVSPLGEEVVAKLISPEPRKGSCLQMAIVTPSFRRQTECEPCTCQDQQSTYTAIT
jgi:hypothetical protein